MVSINDKTAEGVKQNLTAAKLNSEFRYYTGMDILTRIRLYLNYGYNSIKNGDLKSKYKTLWFDFRLYFRAMVEDVELEPFIKIAYNTGLNKNLPSIQNLEWYFEAKLGYNAEEISKVLNFNATTGITWYLPAL